MEIKLNKQLQSKLDVFINTKQEKLNQLLNILAIKEFNFSKEEINKIEELYKQNPAVLREYIYI